MLGGPGKRQCLGLRPKFATVNGFHNFRVSLNRQHCGPLLGSVATGSDDRKDLASIGQVESQCERAIVLQSDGLATYGDAGHWVGRSVDNHVRVDLKAEAFTVGVDSGTESLECWRIHRLSGFFFENGLEVTGNRQWIGAATECVILLHVVGNIGPVIVDVAVVAGRWRDLVAFRDQVEFSTVNCISNGDSIRFPGLIDVEIPVVNATMDLDFLHRVFNRVRISVAGDFQQP